MGYLEENKDKITYTPGGSLCQVFGAGEKANASIALVTMDEGEKGIYHYHDNITEIYVFSKGEGTITINGIEHKVCGNDCFVIPPKNGHLINAKTRMEFECICTPPWEEQHEFIIEEGNIISELVIERKSDYGKILDLASNGYVLIGKLENGEKIEEQVESEYVNVYYFSNGTGKISIDGVEQDIHQAECFLVYPNSKVVIMAESELTYSKVKDKNNVSLKLK